MTSEQLIINQLDRIDRLTRDAEELLKITQSLLDLLSELVQDDDCSYDHHGYCQTHGLLPYPCANGRAREVMKAWKERKQ